jgi:hypothetical protein
MTVAGVLAVVVLVPLSAIAVAVLLDSAHQTVSVNPVVMTVAEGLAVLVQRKKVVMPESVPQVLSFVVVKVERAVTMDVVESVDIVDQVQPAISRSTSVLTLNPPRIQMVTLEVLFQKSVRRVGFGTLMQDSVWRSVVSRWAGVTTVGALAVGQPILACLLSCFLVLLEFVGECRLLQSHDRPKTGRPGEMEGSVDFTSGTLGHRPE